MAMNLCHRLCCNSDRWAREVEGQLLPWVLDGVDLGDNTLEIGPGYGAITRVLVDRTPRLTAVEVDAAMARRLQGLYGDRAHIVNGDGTRTGLPAGAFHSVRFRLLHMRDTCNTISPQALPDRLRTIGFRDVRVEVRGGRLRWRARKP